MPDLETIKQITDLTGIALERENRIPPYSLNNNSYVIKDERITHLSINGISKYSSFEQKKENDDDDDDRLFGRAHPTSLRGIGAFKPKKDIDLNDLLEKISLLHELQQLELTGNGIESIQQLATLKKLTYIDLSKNKISNIRPLSEMMLLEWINLQDNAIVDFEDLSIFTQLKFISLSSNKIEEMPEWFVDYLFFNASEYDAQAIKILKVYVVKNQQYEYAARLRDWEKKLLAGEQYEPELPNEMRLMLRDAILLKGNPIVKPPLNVLRQDRNATLEYFKQMNQANGESSSLVEVKLLVVGEGGTGKTSFVRKIKKARAILTASKDTTLGIEVSKWTYFANFPKASLVNKSKFNTNIWDFGGQRIYQGTHQLFFSEKSLYVLVAETREQQTDFAYWLNTVKQLGGDDSPVVIVINKKYGHEQKFDEDGYRNYFGSLIKDVIQINLSDFNGNILDMQERIKGHIKNIPGIGDNVPSSWLSVRDEILNNRSNFISADKFTEICSGHGIDGYDSVRLLSNYFNRLGVFSHYINDSVLMDRIYLNSNWLVKTVYKVLDSEVVKHNKGRINIDDIQRIWADNELKQEIPKLSQLMHNFGLMYHIGGTNDYVVPAHLPNSRPYDQWEYSSSKEVFYFIYKFDKYMPRGIMSKLIVALHKYVDNHEMVWHMGLNIRLHESYAEIIETYGSDNSFDIRIVGKNKTELLSIIRERFADITAPFTNLNFSQLVPCNCEECLLSANPAFHDYDRLLKFREKNKPSQCNNTGELIVADSLLKLTQSAPITKPQNTHKPMQTITLFLASSSELEEDRKTLREFISVENDRLHSEGLYVKIIQWEYFMDTLSKDGLQNEYNKKVKDCDIFLSLYFTKVGKYTAEEFENAFGQFHETGRPFIYTYFKSGQVDLDKIGEDDIISKFRFEKKLKDLGHFKSSYTDINDLKVQLKRQLDIVLPILTSNT